MKFEVKGLHKLCDRYYKKGVQEISEYVTFIMFEELRTAETALRNFLNV